MEDEPRTRGHVLGDSVGSATSLHLSQHCLKWKVKLQISASASASVWLQMWECAVPLRRPCASVCSCLAEYSTFLHTELQRLDSTQAQKRPHRSAPPKRIVFRLGIIFKAHHSLSSQGLYVWVHTRTCTDEQQEHSFHTDNWNFKTIKIFFYVFLTEMNKDYCLLTKMNSMIILFDALHQTNCN